MTINYCDGRMGEGTRDSNERVVRGMCGIRNLYAKGRRTVVRWERSSTAWVKPVSRRRVGSYFCRLRRKRSIMKFHFVITMRDPAIGMNCRLKLVPEWVGSYFLSAGKEMEYY